MKSHSVTTIQVGLIAVFTAAAIASSFAQSRIREVEWPGIGKTSAICVKKDGWYICMLPEGTDHKHLKPKVFDGEGKEKPTRLLHVDTDNGICLFESDTQESVSSEHFSVSATSMVTPGLALFSLLPKSREKTLVTGKDRNLNGKELPTPLLRIRAENTSDLKAGTPLINEAGELEGLVTHQKLEMPSEIHAISAGLIRKVISDVELHRRSGRAWVGMFFESSTSLPQVIEVKAGSPADKAGLQSNDVVISVDGQNIDDLADLVEVFKLLPVGKTSKFKVLRGLQEVQLQVIPEFAN